jgi:predicted nucleic acid-binding protein
MITEPVFVDTNILVYAHDTEAGEKHVQAREIVESLWNRDLPPSISVQVLQEFYVNLVKKEVPLPAAHRAVRNYFVWFVVENDRQLLVNGMDEQVRWKLSFWDALILAAARRSKARAIWSEDFNTGQDYDGIVAVNPLR